MTLFIALEEPAHRLIPTRYPPVGAFETVADADDLEAVMAVEGWTNDRLVQHRLRRLPRERWVYGRPNASVVMAAFLHAAPAGGRFSGSDLGAWYCSLALRTAIAEVAHHLRREAANLGWAEMRGQYRCYTARLAGAYADIRGQRDGKPELYDPADWSQSQRFGEAMRAAGHAGIVYDSVRHRGGTNAVAYDPRLIENVMTGAAFALRVPRTGRVIAETMT